MGNKLLLADDSITIQKVVAIIFANEEFELTVVDNGNAALEKAREIRPDVMLVDALMPGKTGYEVCAEIRRDPALHSVPILLLIGAFEPVDEEKTRDCGADASITKPFESQQLIDRVKELLELGKTRASAPPPAPVAAPRPLPIESGAEELWGDLSSFDTMPPVAAPASFAAPAAPAPAEPVWAAPAPAAAAWQEPAPAAPVWQQAAPAAPLWEEPAPAAASFATPKEPAAATAPIQEGVVEASYEDDLWGAFEIEEAPKAPAAAPSQVFGVFEPDSEFEAEEFFSFEDESEAIEETGPALDLGYAVEEPVVHASAEELFSFEEEPSLGQASEPEPFQLPEYEPFSFEPEPAAPVAPSAPAAPAAAPAAPAEAAPAARFVAPVMEDVLAFEPQGAPVSQPAVPGVAETKAQPGAVSFSEADLAAAIARISKEVIERIVWEVVPDLAEVLIKEEIRKLKAGTRG